jgi:hypothetical protein
MDTRLEEVDRLVRERFPKLATEWSCAMEKRMRDAARASYRQKLLDELQRQETVLDTGGQADAKA